VVRPAPPNGSRRVTPVSHTFSELGSVRDWKAAGQLRRDGLWPLHSLRVEQAASRAGRAARQAHTREGRPQTNNGLPRTSGARRDEGQPPQHPVPSCPAGFVSAQQPLSPSPAPGSGAGRGGKPRTRQRRLSRWGAWEVRLCGSPVLNCARVDLSSHASYNCCSNAAVPPGRGAGWASCVSPKKDDRLEALWALQPPKAAYCITLRIM
jgi:hypothetical protein